MPKAIFILPDQTRRELKVPEGVSLMNAAVTAGINSIVGECGGAMSCATCHVLVEGPIAARLEPPGDTESQMLEYTAAPRQANSRLSCQIAMRADLDGIEVRVAFPQI